MILELIATLNSVYICVFTALTPPTPHYTGLKLMHT